MRQVFWALAAFGVFVSLMVFASSPEVLIFTDGTRMEVEHFELRGATIVFATAEGELQSVPASLVDQPATARANGLTRLGLPTAEASALPPTVFSPPSALTQGDEGTISVNENGSPAAGVDIFLFVNQGKQPLGTTNNVGQLPFDPALLTGKVRVTVAVRECPQGTEVYLVSVETDDACREVEDASDEPDCRCDVVGAIWWGPSISVDVTSLVAEGAGSSITQNPWFWLATGAAVGTGVIVGTSGDSDTDTVIPQPTISTGISPMPTPPPAAPLPTPTPAPTAAETNFSGPYDIDVIQIEDPAGHFPFIGNLPGSIDVFGNNGNFRATGQQPWVRVDGNISMSSGDFDANGQGNVAGRSGIRVRFSGHIDPMSPYRITGWYEMGVNGGLPTGRPIRYRIDGQMR